MSQLKHLKGRYKLLINPATSNMVETWYSVEAPAAARKMFKNITKSITSQDPRTASGSRASEAAASPQVSNVSYLIEKFIRPQYHPYVATWIALGDPRNAVDFFAVFGAINRQEQLVESKAAKNQQTAKKKELPPLSVSVPHVPIISSHHRETDTSDKTPLPDPLSIGYVPHRVLPRLYKPIRSNLLLYKKEDGGGGVVGKASLAVKG
eukprot:PhF_6_TR3367/c0_g1_i1/m.4794